MVRRREDNNNVMNLWSAASSTARTGLCVAYFVFIKNWLIYLLKDGKQAAVKLFIVTNITVKQQ